MARQSPLISILMPVFNASSTLQECMESIFTQTLEDFEVVIVDDGSTDRTPELVEQYAKKDLRVVLIKQERGGIVKALNKGLQHCRGVYIARMDGDDVMFPQRLEKQLRFLQENSHLDLIGSRYQNASDSPQTPGMIEYESWSNSCLSNEEIKQEIFVECPILHPTFFAEKLFFNKMGGYQDYPWPEDYDFLLRAHVGGAKFGKVDEPLLYRGNPPYRLTRTDTRYKRPAMFQAKVHYLLEKDVIKDKQEVVVVGSGSSGRQVAEVLKGKNIPIRFFLDNIEGSPDRTVMDIPARGFSREIPGSFMQSHSDCFFCLCIGDKRGKRVMEEILQENGFQFGDNYMTLI